MPGSYISPFSFRILQKKCPRSLSNSVGGISLMFLFSPIDVHHLFRSDWVFLFLLRCLSTNQSSSQSSKDRQVEMGSCWSSRQGSKLVAARVPVGWTRSSDCRWLMGEASSEQMALVDVSSPIKEVVPKKSKCNSSPSRSWSVIPSQDTLFGRT